MQEFETKLEKTLDLLNSDKLNYILCGDFNINLLDSNNNNISNYISTIESPGCKQFIKDPTRYSSITNATTLLDHVYSNLLESQLNCWILHSDISDHLPTIAFIKNTNNKSRPTEATYQHNMKYFDKSKFMMEVQTTMETLLNETYNDVNSLVDSFISKFKIIICKHAPLTKLNRKQERLRQKPWLTTKIKKQLRKKERLYKKFIRVHTSQSYITYKRQRNTVTHLIQKSKKDYYKKIFAESKYDSRSTWKNVEQIIRFKEKKKNCINTIENSSGNPITNPQEICEEFNKHFINVGKKISDSVQPTNLSCTNLIQPISKSMFLSPVTSIEVYDIISDMNFRKKTPSFSPLIKFIKYAAEQISPVLSKIFNMCISEGIFPNQFKIAEVLPLHKSGSKFNLHNFRPISLLSPFSKIFEKCIYARLYNFLTKNNILNNSQFGFRENSSTENAVLQMCNNILESLDKKETVCSLFVDLRKAFETVNHKILLQKLYQYGVRGQAYKLIASFLHDRKQYTICNSFQSNCGNVTCGVPQGSTLGPLLFLIYINDLSQVTNTKLNLFADDACFSLSHKSPQLLEKNMNSEISKLTKWLSINKL